MPLYGKCLISEVAFASADGIHDAGKLCQHSVAGVLHHAAMVFSDLRVN